MEKRYPLMLFQILQLIKSELLIESNQITLETLEANNPLEGFIKHKQNDSMEEVKHKIQYGNVTLNYDSIQGPVEFVKFCNEAYQYNDEIKEAMKSLNKSEGFYFPTIQEQIESGSFNILIVNTDNGDRIKEVAEFGKLPENLKLFINTDKNIATSAGMNFPGLLIYNSADRNTYQASMPAHGGEVVGIAQLSVLDFFNETTESYYTSYDSDFYIFITNEEELASKIRIKYLKEFIPFSSNLKVALFKASQAEHINNLFKIKEGEYPALCRLDNGKKFIVKNASLGKIKEAIFKHRNGEAERIIMNEELPSDNGTLGMKVINYNTFQKRVFENEEINRITLFTNESCGYCKQVKPVYAKFSEAAIKHGLKIEIFNYDLQRNDLPENDEIKIKGIPYIIFQSKNSKEVEVIGGIRKMEDLLNFFEKKIEGFRKEDFNYLIENSKSNEDAGMLDQELLGKLNAENIIEDEKVLDDEVTKEVL